MLLKVKANPYYSADSAKMEDTKLSQKYLKEMN